MRQLTIIPFLLVLLAVPAMAQVICARSSGTLIDMQVFLSLDDHTSLLTDAEAGSGGLSASAGSSTDAGATPKNAQEFRPEMQIRVELQDDFGTRITEQNPNAEGKVTFRVCSRAVYRVRVTGHDIEESVARDLTPGRGDKIVNLSLHRKESKAQKKRDAALVSANRLKIPRKAQKAFEKGNQALANNNLEEAKSYYEKAVTEYPKFDQAYNNLGVVLMKKGDRAAGKAAFEKAIAVNDHFARALTNLAKIDLDEKQYPQALELARKSLAVEPLNPHTLLLASETAFFTQAYDDCISFSRSLHNLPHGGLGLAHFFSARSLEKKDLPQQAIAEYQMFLNEDPLDPNVPNAQMAIVELKASAGTN